MWEHEVVWVSFYPEPKKEMQTVLDEHSKVRWELVAVVAHHCAEIGEPNGYYLFFKRPIRK